MMAHEVRRVRVSHDDGQGLAEYALILMLIAMVAIAALLVLGPQISTMLSQMGALIRRRPSPELHGGLVIAHLDALLLADGGAQHEPQALHVRGELHGRRAHAGRQGCTCSGSGHRGGRGRAATPGDDEGLGGLHAPEGSRA